MKAVMREELIPSFNVQDVLIDPWAADFDIYVWILVMGFLVNLACGLVGNFIVVRRMALVGDAISHSVLPGLVIAFLFTGSFAISFMLLGAIVAGVLTTVLIEVIHKNSRIKTDAALGIVFSLFFAIGVILINVYAGQVHLDAECVLYGEINHMAEALPVVVGGIELAPVKIILMGTVTVAIVLLILVFYKELLVTSFDPGLAQSLGIKVNHFHYGLMIVLSIVIVCAFESVGVILVIAMLIFPATTSAMVSDRLSHILLLTFPLSLLYTIGGLHLALWLNTSISASMVVVAVFIFMLTWVFSPRRGVLTKLLASGKPNAAKQQVAPQGNDLT